MTDLPVVIPAGNGREVRAYASIIEQHTIDQALAMARHPLVKEPVRLMADCHAGVGGAGTVGSVIVMEGGLIPAAIGPDIGCPSAACMALSASVSISNTTDSNIEPALNEPNIS